MHRREREIGPVEHSVAGDVGDEQVANLRESGRARGSSVSPDPVRPAMGRDHRRSPLRAGRRARESAGRRRPLRSYGRKPRDLRPRGCRSRRARPRRRASAAPGRACGTRRRPAASARCAAASATSRSCWRGSRARAPSRSTSALRSRRRRRRLPAPPRDRPNKPVSRAKSPCCEANAAAADEVDGGEQDHDCRNALRKRLPAADERSG